MTRLSLTWYLLVRRVLHLYLFLYCSCEPRCSLVPFFFILEMYNLKIGSFQVKLLLHQGTDDGKEGPGASKGSPQQEDEQLATLTGQQPGTKSGHP